MKNKKILKLEEIKVESFITSLSITSLSALDCNEQKAAKGGLNEGLGTTNVRVFC